MEIRLMTADDYGRAYGLWERTPGMGLSSIDDSEEGFRRYIKRNPSTSFLAVERGKTVGTILCGHDGRRGFIYHACVDKSHRAVGIGRALVARALEALKEEGITKCALVTFQDNLIGNAFWSRSGWTLRKDLNYYNLVLNEENKPSPVQG